MFRGSVIHILPRLGTEAFSQPVVQREGSVDLGGASIPPECGQGLAETPLPPDTVKQGASNIPPHLSLCYLCRENS